MYQRKIKVLWLIWVMGVQRGTISSYQYSRPFRIPFCRHFEKTGSHCGCYDDFNGIDRLLNQYWLLVKFVNLPLFERRILWLSVRKSFPPRYLPLLSNFFDLLFHAFLMPPQVFQVFCFWNEKFRYWLDVMCSADSVKISIFQGLRPLRWFKSSVACTFFHAIMENS